MSVEEDCSSVVSAGSTGSECGAGSGSGGRCSLLELLAEGVSLPALVTRSKQDLLKEVGVST